MNFLEAISRSLGIFKPRAYEGGGPIGGGQGYNGASSGRRMSGWQGSILGPNTLTLGAWQKLIQRSRDAVRNYPLAASAIQRFESNMVGTGIQPHFTHPDPAIKLELQGAWDKWVKKADFAGQLSFYGLQSLLSRSLFEAGECFCRWHVVDDDNYFQLQLIESEQVPIYLNMTEGEKTNTVIREGIIFNQSSDKRVGYRIYQGQPYDSIINPYAATQFVNISSDDMIQIMKPLRPGQLRGVSIMTPVLQLLYDIENYADSERLRKRLASMFAFFVTKQNSYDEVIPPSIDGPVSNDPNVDFSRLEPGTIQELLPGESLISPQIPESGDYSTFMATELHRFAAAVGITYEMLTSDYSKVNFSSARMALIEFRRQAEQFQQHILVDQFCQPVLEKWMNEAVLSGALDLPNDYVKDPSKYTACDWIADGFSFVDPLKEVQGLQMAVRSGFTSRSMVIRQNGFDPATVDGQIAEERAREKLLGIITDTNSNEVLIGKETQPLSVTPVDPNQESDDEADENDQ